MSFTEKLKHKYALSSNIHPKFEIGSYEDLYKIVMEPEELENIGVRNRRHSNEA